MRHFRTVRERGREGRARESRRRSRNRYIYLAVGLLLAFHFIIGFPPTSAKQRPTYLRIDKDNTETIVLTWVGRASGYEVTSIRSIYMNGYNHQVAQDFFIVWEPRFEEPDVLEAMTYFYRVRGVDADGNPISHWSRFARRRLELTGSRPNVFDNPPTPVR